MANVDQFESIFRSSVKERLEYQDIPIRSVLLITDLHQEAARVYKKQVEQFLSTLGSKDHWDCFLVTGEEFTTTEELLQLVAGYALDLICSYRNLHSGAWRFPHSLGEHLDVLIQKTPLPVLILPHPKAGYMAAHAMQDTREVMVVTDMVAINHELINYAVRLTRPGGTLFLSHVENRYIFERYIDAIGKIESLNTEVARTRLAEQLLKEPEDYFLSCAGILKEHGIDLDVRSMVTLGDAVAEYKRQIDARKLDLLVMHARDEGQQAMNAVAYPLAVELRQVPLLMV